MSSGPRCRAWHDCFAQVGRIRQGGEPLPSQALSLMPSLQEDGAQALPSPGFYSLPHGEPHLMTLKCQHPQLQAYVDTRGSVGAQGHRARELPLHLCRSWWPFSDTKCALTPGSTRSFPPLPGMFSSQGASSLFVACSRRSSTAAILNFSFPVTWPSFFISSFGILYSIRTYVLIAFASM